LQLISILSVLYALVMILSSSSAAKVIAKRCWPIFLLVALTFASATWSTAPSMTFKSSVAFLQTVSFGLALATRLSQKECLPFVIRVMLLGCLLSLAWVVVFPKTSIHQATDIIQNVHAGLWRGVFTHKQGLGTFAEFCIGFLLFYGATIFSSRFLRVGALACALACLWGSQSATGTVIAVTSTVSLYVAFWISRLPPALRRPTFYKLLLVISVVILAFYFGLLSSFSILLGKEPNLSGRSDTWWIIQNNFAGSGRLMFGGGFGSDFLNEMAQGYALDNGFIKKLLEFGYVGSATIFGVFIWLIFASIGLASRSISQHSAINVFPLSLLITLSVYSLTETGLMEKHITTILFAIAVFMIFAERPLQGAPNIASLKP
jgi:exopolysaccharide production protein ExoQ